MPPDGTPPGLGGFGALGDPSVALSVEIGDDGSVELAAPAVHTRDEEAPESFNDNLADRFDCGMLAHDLIEGIDSDILSRKELMQDYADGMKLLGLSVENTDSSKNTRNTKGRSRVGHPLLLASLVDFQSGASGELLPAGGPVKTALRDGDTEAEGELADDLADDMNWYLTTGAPEYYTGMDRGLFDCGYGGNLFRAVYKHPIRRRPVVDSISMDNMIVSEDAIDLDTALRVTERSEMTRQQVKHMQFAKAWLPDLEFGQPNPVQDDAQRARDQISGIQRMSIRPKDQPFTIYQCTTDICMADHGWSDPLATDEMPISYRVTMDRDSKQVASIYRSWRHGDEMFQRKQRYVHYGMVPGFGFLCLGYLHLLGNQTKALRAIWRLLIDAGMFSNFPGGMKAKSIRTSTNEIDPGPGEWKDVDISGFDRIQDAFMAMPYKGPDGVFIQLAELIGKESAAVAGAVKMPVAEGRADIPVGTMLAMIEQATKMDSAVHKRLYRAQARELELLKECFADNPETLWKLNPDPKRQWQTRAEIMDQNIVPVADPNVPSQLHRIMLGTAMIQEASNPISAPYYKQKRVRERVWKSVGLKDTDDFLQDAPQQNGPPPDPAKMAKVQVDQAKLQETQAENQRKAASTVAEAQQRTQDVAADLQGRREANESAERIAAMKEQTERVKMTAEVEKTRGELAHKAADTTLEHARHGDEMAVKREAAMKPEPEGGE
jgi:hypothetical protein